MVRIHIIQHVSFEGPGFISHWAELRGYHLTVTRLDLGESLPVGHPFDLLVVMGGPMGVNDLLQYPWLADEITYVQQADQNGKRILGICLGAQLLAAALGAPVVANREKEIGWFPIQRDPAASSALAEVFPSRFWAFHWHGETFGIPDGAESLGESEACANQGFLWKNRSVGLQFHLEADAESIAALLAHAKADLLHTGPFVQSESRILAGIKEHGKQVNTLMALLLDQMV